MSWTLHEVADYCDNFRCYAEIDGDKRKARLYWLDGTPMGITLNLW